jgi:hypothetical protein
MGNGALTSSSRSSTTTGGAASHVGNNKNNILPRYSDEELRSKSLLEDAIDCQDQSNCEYENSNRRMLNNSDTPIVVDLDPKSMDKKDVKESIHRALLQKLFIFKSFERKYMDKLVGCFIPKRFEEGEVVIQQGVEGEYM